MSDGVAYAAKDLGCDIVLDMATLTGAQGIATGRYHASHMSNQQAWEEAVSYADAGRFLQTCAFVMPSTFLPSREILFPVLTADRISG